MAEPAVRDGEALGGACVVIDNKQLPVLSLSMIVEALLFSGASRGGIDLGLRQLRQFHVGLLFLLQRFA